MQYLLVDIIKKLKSSPRVRGIFTTGTTAYGFLSSSDIDLVIILDKNSEEIRSIFAIIENRFADIFFFDISFLNKIKNLKEIPSSSLEGIFINWLKNGKIEYDPENILSPFKNKIESNNLIIKVTDRERDGFWIKINYNFIANNRHYNAENDIYHKALELRLLYSVSELISAYFSFRNIPWRGEKAAIKYFEKNDEEFLKIFQKYSKSGSLKEKMEYYEELFKKVFYGEYKEWDDNFIIPISNQNQFNPKLLGFWNKLISGDYENR